ncbi:unnamed protein product [Effrenium voratum]|nr:unnamed protein product [Effrenium voratum]
MLLALQWHSAKHERVGQHQLALVVVLPSEDSSLVILDERHPPLPLVEKTSNARGRALCLLGCPAGLTDLQELAFARAARAARWQVRRFRLGDRPEFASKVVARK